MSGDAPAFGIVAPMRDGVFMFLRGAVWCTITEGGTTRQVSGEQALTWVDQIVPGTFEQLEIGGVAGRPVQADPLTDLRGGVVRGQGFVLTRTAGTPGPDPALAESGAGAAGAGLAGADADRAGADGADADRAGADRAGFAEAGPAGADQAWAGSAWAGSAGAGAGSAWGGAGSAGADLAGARPADDDVAAAGYAGSGAGPESATDARSAGYVWARSEEPPGQAADQSQEEWALRAEGQQNHQPTMVARSAGYQATPRQAEPGLDEDDRLAGDRDGFGEPLQPVQATTVTPVQPRPAGKPLPLGMLVSQDGLTIVLDRVYVLGREPQQDPAVESGEAAPVQLPDPDHVISRVHAYVSVENGIVLVRDAESMHGTYLSPPGDEQWSRVGTEPSPLPPGWSLQIGPQVFTFKLSEPEDDR
jgi:hypothetical protein